MALDDLKFAPTVSYADLIKITRQSEESILWVTERAERIHTFLLGISAYITAYPEIDKEKRAFILESYHRFYDRETQIARERFERLKENGII